MFGKIGMFHGDQGVSPELCNEINEEILNKIEPQEGEIGAGTAGTKDNVVRSTAIRWISPYTEELYNKLIGVIMPYIHTCNRTNYCVDISGGCNEIQHTEYTEGQHYRWHMDTDFAPLEINTQRYAMERKLSITIQLSDADSYDGGDLEFFEREINLPKHLVRKQGTVIIFPSFLQHRVTMVNEGTRHSLVSWIEGTPWR